MTLREKAREMACLAMTYPLGTAWEPSDLCERRMRAAMAAALEWAAMTCVQRADYGNLIKAEAAIRAEAARLRAEVPRG